MFIDALFDPLSLFVLVVIIVLTATSFVWYRGGQRQFDILAGGLQTLRRVGLDLPPEHPIRRRLEAAPVVDLSFEEIAKLMTGERVDPAARSLIRLQDKVAWIERFSQYSIHLGILGTVFALVSSDPTNLESFRASLPLALGTTFWGLIGALLLSTVAGATESVLEKAKQHIRQVLLNALDDPSNPRSARSGSPIVLDELTPQEEGGDDFLDVPRDEDASGSPLKEA